MTAQIEVTLVKSGTRMMAVTTDGIKCYILERPDDAQPGDRWAAKAVQGRIKGESGHSKVQLLNQLSQGFAQEVPGHWMDSRNLEALQVYLSRGIHPLLIGPPATGKTTLGQRLAAARGWEFLLVECANVWTPKAIFGADAAHDGSTRFVPSRLTRWLEEVASESTDITHLLALDEVNRMAGLATNSFVGLLGPERRTSVETVDGSREIVLPPNVGVIASANLGREYSGTMPLDRAFKDRLQPIVVEPAPVEASVTLLKPRFETVTSSDIRAVVISAQELRSQFDSRATLRTPPSFRGIEAALALRERGWSLVDCLVQGFLSEMSQAERRDIWEAIRVRLPEMPQLPGSPDVPEKP